MSADAELPVHAVDRTTFDRFYDEALPVVYGYLLRLCAGDREQAWDLTQDSWIAVVDELRRGHDEKATIGFLLSVARTRFIDQWRRQHALQRKLQLVWAAERTSDAAGEISTADVLSRLDRCEPRHRLVLMMAYIDEMPVTEIAAQLGVSTSSAYALLARARTELRRRLEGATA